MVSVELLTNNKIELIVDTSIYSDSVISKVLYWLTDRFIITRENIENGGKQRIVLERAEGIITPKEYSAFRIKISQDITDYKNREIIHEETKDIRSILYVKAFAQNDDFVEIEFSE